MDRFLAAQLLLPVVQLVIRVGNGNPGVPQITDGASDVSGSHVVSRVVVKEDDQHSFVMAIGGQDHQVMQAIEVSVMPRQDGPLIADGVGKVNLVAASGQSDVRWDLDIVAVTSE